jgi:hypothetical protein
MVLFRRFPIGPGFPFQSFVITQERYHKRISTAIFNAILFYKSFSRFGDKLEWYVMLNLIPHLFYKNYTKVPRH